MKKADTASEITTSRIQPDMPGFRVGGTTSAGDCGICAQLEAAEDSGCCCPGTELISIV